MKACQELQSFRNFGCFRQPVGHIIPDSRTVGHMITSDSQTVDATLQTAGHVTPDSQTVGHITPDSQTVVHVTPDSQTVGHVTPDSGSRHSRQRVTSLQTARQWMTLVTKPTITFVKGSAATSIIYCPSPFFLTHILKLLTQSQTFKKVKKLGQRSFGAVSRAYIVLDVYLQTGAFWEVLLSMILLEITPGYVIFIEKSEYKEPSACFCRNLQLQARSRKISLINIKSALFTCEDHHDAKISELHLVHISNRNMVPKSNFCVMMIFTLKTNLQC